MEYKIQIIEPKSEEKLDQLNKLLNKQYTSTLSKINGIKSTFGTLCGYCRSEKFNYPARKVVFQLDGIQRTETYCLECFHKAGYSDTTKKKKRKVTK